SIAAMVLSYRWMLAVVVAIVAGVAMELLTLRLAPTEAVTGFGILTVVLATSLLLLVLRWHQGNLEALRARALRESETAVRASEERLRTLVENSHDLIVVMDRDGKRREAYGAVEAMTGFRLADRGPLSHFEAMHPEDLPRIRQEFVALLKQPTGTTVRTEWRQRHKDGRYRWLEGLASNRLGVPAVDGIVICIRDVTQRRVTDEAMRRNEERYQSLFATITDAILLSNEEERLIEVNDAACRQLGYSRAELLGLHLLDIVPEDERARFASVQQRLAQAGHLLVEANQRRKDGTVIPVELAVSLIKLDGKPAFMAVSRDISERRQGEAERRRLEEQLQHAGKMESIGRLAGGVAHDFNNLLTAILGNIELISHQLRAGESIHQALADIRETGLSAAALTRQLLAFSRKQVIEPHLIDPNELLQRMHKMLERLIGEDIELRTVQGESVGTVRADPSLIEQAIVNLVVNARDAMPSGGVLIVETKHVILDADYQRAHPLVPPGRYAMFAVSDTGTGMTDEVKRHLFEPFFTTKPRGQGTGLGLATTYGAIRQSNGHITVYTEVGKGTTFKIYLPAMDAHSERLITPSPDEPYAMVGGSETILVVEDDTRVRDLVARSLGTRGYRVMVAASGEEAMALAGQTEEKIHLLLTDVVMPRMNGRQLSEQLTKIHPEMRTLFTSGYTENIIAHHGVLDKGINFLSKPYALEALARRVRGLLDG
ncbi:MAG TPA: PAS domain S-box protein, partial [Polyangia bacterium]